MILFLCFAAVSLLGALPICLSVFHLGVGISLLIAFFVFFLLHVLFVLFFGLYSHPVPMDKPLEKVHPMSHFAAYTAASLLCFYGGVKAVINGSEKLPKDCRFLFVCNHRSIFDPIIVMDKLRDYNIAFISKPSNMKIPIIGHALYCAGFLAIDRENDRNALKTILTAADYLKRDICSIGIFPEGTRSKTMDLLPFHAGSFKIAQRAKVPLVIACVSGSEKAQIVNPFNAATVHLDILEVLSAEDVSSMRTDALAAHASSLIQDHLNHVEQKV